MVKGEKQNSFFFPLPYSEWKCECKFSEQDCKYQINSWLTDSILFMGTTEGIILWCEWHSIWWSFCMVPKLKWVVVVVSGWHLWKQEWDEKFLDNIFSPNNSRPSFFKHGLWRRNMTRGGNFFGEGQGVGYLLICKLNN